MSRPIIEGAEGAAWRSAKIASRPHPSGTRSPCSRALQRFEDAYRISSRSWRRVFSGRRRLRWAAGAGRYSIGAGVMLHDHAAPLRRPSRTIDSEAASGRRSTRSIRCRSAPPAFSPQRGGAPAGAGRARFRPAGPARRRARACAGAAASGRSSMDVRVAVEQQVEVERARRVAETALAAVARARWPAARRAARAARARSRLRHRVDEIGLVDVADRRDAIQRGARESRVPGRRSSSASAYRAPAPRGSSRLAPSPMTCAASTAGRAQRLRLAG